MSKGLPITLNGIVLYLKQIFLIYIQMESKWQLGTHAQKATVKAAQDLDSEKRRQQMCASEAITYRLEKYKPSSRHNDVVVKPKHHPSKASTTRSVTSSSRHTPVHVVDQIPTRDTPPATKKPSSSSSSEINHSTYFVQICVHNIYQSTVCLLHDCVRDYLKICIHRWYY